MIPPFKRVPIQPQVIHMLLPLELPTVKNTILSLIGVKGESEWIEILRFDDVALNVRTLKIIKEHINKTAVISHENYSSHEKYVLFAPD
jgi:hypothetical protein